MDRRSALRRFAGAGVAITLAGCLESAGGGDDGGHDVGMSTVAFQPQEVSVERGETVVWRNTSSHAHTVTAYENSLPEGAAFFSTGDFDSESAARDGWLNARGRLGPGGTYEYTFEVAGSYPYFCIPHERSGMVGTVHVGSTGTESGSES